MSLLFDALKRAQGTDGADAAKQVQGAVSNNAAKCVQDTDGAKPVELQLQDLTPPSGSQAEWPGSAEGAGTVKTMPATTRRQPHTIWPYAAATLMLLTGGVAWFFYQQNQHISIAAQDLLPTLAAVTAVKIPALPASNPDAPPRVTDTAAREPTLVNSQTSRTDTAINQDPSWTHPAEAKKPTPKQHRHKPATPVILAGADHGLLDEGYLALSEGRLDQAEQSYLKVLALHPHEKDALLGLAVVAHRKMQAERASSLYRQVLREDLGNTTAAAGLVNLSMRADPVAAESQLRELLDLKPAAAEFHYALGSVLARQLRWGEAQQAFFRAYSLAPDNTLYAYNLAVTLDRLHQFAAALPYYKLASRPAKPDGSILDQDAIGRRIQELDKAKAESR